MKFNFLNFCTKYKSEGTDNIKLKTQACFSDIFYGHKENPHNKYTLYIYDDKTKDGDDNSCLLTREQIIDHIENGRKFHNFTYTLKRNPDDDGYILKVDLKGPRIYHKFMLTWFRYLYEFPYNICLWETYKVRNIYGFKQMSTINLFNLISTTFKYSAHGTDIHCIGEFYKIKPLMNNRAIKARLKELPYRVNDIFKTVFTDDVKDFKFIKGNCKDIEYWANEKNFKDRIKVYKADLKLIKELK